MNRSKITGALTGGVIATALLISGVAFAAGPSPHAAFAPGHNKIQCFDGTTDGGFGGTCTLKSMGVNAPATLSNNSSNPNGDYSGVFYQNSMLIGKTLGSVTQLGYTYSGTLSPLPGNLSLNVPIDTTGDGATDAYAFVDAFYCPGTNGTVDVINDTNCGIWFNGVEYANWAAFTAAFPSATISDLPFVVAERTPAEPAAVWTVTNVHLGQK